MLLNPLIHPLNSIPGKMPFRATLLVLSAILPCCSSNTGTLLPSWQQDSVLIYNGHPAALPQTSETPHLVARACYSAPGQIEKLIARQGDSPEPVQQLAVMGDGTFALGFSDAASGRWLDVQECGGQLFVSGLPNQAYRIHVSNLTPMPLDLAIGMDGKDLGTGKVSTWKRSSLRIEARKTLIFDRDPLTQRPLLFGTVTGDHALFETHPEGTRGLIQVAAWLAADAPSVPGQKLRPSQYAPGSLIPLDRPEQFR